MATRRIVATEKTFLDKDDPIDETSSTAPAVPSQVIYKLLAFTLAMIVVPIGSYFLTVNTVFNGKSLLAFLRVTTQINAAQSDQLKPESKKDK
ncbi:vacuolar atpase assembly integral membrane protein vma21 [Fusarium flagelliforme]|uniref:Vacuolar atpase assembly integral membrane protein vma21 n=1 Tax=Fusarium flagelliforme TaxID=2675880 RepID=A0A395MUE1_9HYPO|nr:vacuolar atpase assembly integral membrane protein vma21 [Fusarium flagelliforme]